MAINQKIMAEVVRIVELSADSRCFTIRPVKKISFKPGQFVMANVPYKDTFVRRAYSIASFSDGTIDLCMDHIKGGTASEYFFKLKEGDTLAVDGPYGVFTLRNSGNDKAFICTGTGVAPLRSMVKSLFFNGKASGNNSSKVTLIFGERTEKDILFRKEFEEIENRNSLFKYVPVLSRGDASWDGERGYVQHVMKKYINDTKRVDAYVCGLKEMVDQVKEELLLFGVPADNIFTEKFV